MKTKTQVLKVFSILFQGHVVNAQVGITIQNIYHHNLI